MLTVRLRFELIQPLRAVGLKHQIKFLDARTYQEQCCLGSFILASRFPRSGRLHEAIQPAVDGLTIKETIGPLVVGQISSISRTAQVSPSATTGEIACA
jgi:hypothetical protein